MIVEDIAFMGIFLVLMIAAFYFNWGDNGEVVKDKTTQDRN